MEDGRGQSTPARGVLQPPGGKKGIEGEGWVGPPRWAGCPATVSHSKDSALISSFLVVQHV